jgi:hypothetical protein
MSRTSFSLSLTIWSLVSRSSASGSVVSSSSSRAPIGSFPFSPVTFRECVAGSSSEVFHLEPDAISTNMFEVEGFATRGPDVARTSVISPTTAMVEWVGAPYLSTAGRLRFDHRLLRG